jgi:hypothetical protein
MKIKIHNNKLHKKYYKLRKNNMTQIIIIQLIKIIQVIL